MHENLAVNPEDIQQANVGFLYSLNLLFIQLVPGQHRGLVDAKFILQPGIPV